MKRNPVVIIMSILAALQILTAGSALSDVVGKETTALIVLAIAAVQSGVQFYVRGQVTPNANVAALVDEARGGRVVAGEAADDVSAAHEGEGVAVYPTDEDHEPRHTV